MSYRNIGRILQFFGLTPDFMAMLTQVDWDRYIDEKNECACWFDVTKNFVECRVCGQRQRAFEMAKKFLWLQHHEQIHMVALGEEKLAAFKTLLGLKRMAAPPGIIMMPIAIQGRNGMLYDLRDVLDAGLEIFGPPRRRY